MIDSRASRPVGAHAPSPSFEDRYARLRIFGVVEVVSGVLVALLTPAALLVLLPRIAAGGTTRWLIVICPWLALTATGLVWLGIGSLRAARWARSLNLVLSWIAVGASLAFGVPILIELVRNAESIGTGVAATLVFLLGLGAPLTFLHFYRSKHVQLTCEYHDPIERWTDHQPLPVLAASLLCLFRASITLTCLVLPSGASQGGGYLTLALALTAADFYAAGALLKAKASGWWCALGVELIEAAHTGVRMVGHGDASVLSLPYPSSGKFWTLVMLSANIGYLIWMRRYLQPETSRAAS